MSYTPQDQPLDSIYWLNLWFHRLRKLKFYAYLIELWTKIVNFEIRNVDEFGFFFPLKLGMGREFSHTHCQYVIVVWTWNHWSTIQSPFTLSSSLDSLLGTMSNCHLNELWTNYFFNIKFKVWTSLDKFGLNLPKLNHIQLVL